MKYSSVLLVRDFSEKIHKGQMYGKNGQEQRPYFSAHIEPVVEESLKIARIYNEFVKLFMNYRQSVDENVVKCIAYLHDTVEDQIDQDELDKFLYSQLEPTDDENMDVYDDIHLISCGVYDLTHKKCDSYHDYVNAIHRVECMIVKLADLNVNITNSDHTFKKRDLYLSVRDMIRIKLFGSIV